MDVITNELKYSLGKKSENRRYFRQCFALYPLAIEKCTFQNTVDSRLGSFGMPAGKLVPDENLYKDPEATGVARMFD